RLMVEEAARGRPLRVRGAIVVPLGSVGRHPFRGTDQPTLGIAHGILQSVAQHVKPGAVLVGLDRIGHRWPSMGL
ncbi:MAG TPA: hypothetical protein VEX14_10970, partial [Burkholderiaceae bacterium]|nr:hypothetical protein [Burkholderiaceae bacterium]